MKTSTNDSNQAIYVLTKILAVYNLLLVITSLFFNPLVFYVCVTSKQLRTKSTFKLLAVSSLNDLLACLVWNQECFMSTFFALDIGYMSIHYCRFVSTFLQFVTIQYSSWMLVAVALDRYLSLVINMWPKRFFAGPRPFLLAGLVALLIIVINLNEVFLTGYVQKSQNGSFHVICYSNPPAQIQWYYIMSQVGVYLPRPSIPQSLSPYFR